MSHLAHPPRQSIQQRIVDAIASVTRYPREYLDTDSDLEDDLGIDSVKRAEIAARLATEFSLDTAVLESLNQLRTIEALSEALARGTTASAGASASEEPTSAAASIEPPSPDHAHDRSSSPTMATARAGAARRVEGTISNEAATNQAALGRCFEGKIALVSGSGHGLGRVTALELARHGASVIINSFHNREIGERTVQLLRNEGARAEHIWASVAKSDHVERLFGEIGERFGGLDFFIHNASSGVFAKLSQVTEEHWLKSFRTNILGFHQGALRAAELMRARGGGKILTLSSVYENATMDYFGVQGPIKAGLESLTRFMAKELFDDNIQVNCVSFSALEGHAMTLYPEAERFRITTEQHSQGQRRMTELEAARAQLLLLRRDADSLTGSVVRIDRGMMLWSDAPGPA